MMRMTGGYHARTQERSVTRARCCGRKVEQKMFAVHLSSLNAMLTNPQPVAVTARKRVAMQGMRRVICAGVLVGTSVLPMSAQQGSRGGYNDQYDHRHYDNRDEYDRSHGGIGPGKGALIGGAGGAALGALFGGGLKGALIGGGAGAGVGAIAGKVHQNNQRNDWRDYRR